MKKLEHLASLHVTISALHFEMYTKISELLLGTKLVIFLILPGEGMRFPGAPIRTTLPAPQKCFATCDCDGVGLGELSARDAWAV